VKTVHELPFGADTPDELLAAVELLASAESGVRIVVPESLDGVETQRFRLLASLPDETGELREITTYVWIGVDDGLLRQVVQAGDIVIIVPATGAVPEFLLVPTTITLTCTLGQFGEPVDIPPWVSCPWPPARPELRLEPTAAPTRCARRTAAPGGRRRPSPRRPAPPRRARPPCPPSSFP